MAVDRAKTYERNASIFVGGALFGCALLFIVLTTKKGWFAPKTHYYTVLESGDGVRIGTPVEMVGVRIGSVSSLELDESNQIKVKLSLLKKFQNRIKADSRIMVARPFVIGEKTLHITPGIAKTAKLGEGELIPAQESVGLLDLLNGRKLGPYFQTLQLAAEEMKNLVDMLLKEKSSEKLVRSLTGMPKLVERVTVAANDLSKVSRQLAKEDAIGTLVADLAHTTQELRSSTPELTKDFANVVSNMAVLSEEFKKVIPAPAIVAPDLPKSSQRLVEALDEAVIVLKAMQKSFLLRGSAREVREEEQLRVPASEDSKEKSSFEESEKNEN